MAEPSSKKTKKNPKTLSDIPLHLFVTNILHRLPIKTILSYKVVSKEWYKLISSAKFLKSMMKCGTISSQVLLLPSMDVNLQLISSLSYDDESWLLLEQNDLECVNVAGIDNVHIMDSGNGFICLDLVQADSFGIWNPLTRQFVEVAHPQEMLDIKKSVRIPSVGFGYVQAADDYKIFAEFFHRYKPDQSPYYYLFSTQRGGWRRLNIDQLQGNAIFRRKGAYCGTCVIEAIYWPLTDVVGLGCLNLHTEELSEIEFPVGFTDCHYKRITHIFEMDKCLSICCFKDDNDPCYIWSFKEDADDDGTMEWMSMFMIDHEWVIFGFTLSGKYFSHWPGAFLNLMDPRNDELAEVVESITYLGPYEYIADSRLYFPTLYRLRVNNPANP